MWKRILSWPIALALVSSPAFARGGDGTWGGGNAVVCYASAERRKMVSVDMFDYWEQPLETHSSLPFDLGPESAGVSGMVDHLLDRLARLDPERARRYREEVREILAHLPGYLSDFDLASVEDDHSRVEPRVPCYKTQFAIQLTEPLPLQKKFLIERTIYESPVTTNRARAGILLHELIYRDAIAAGATSSDSARYFNYLLATDTFVSMSLADYAALMASSGLPFPQAASFGGQTLLYYPREKDPAAAPGETAWEVAAPFGWRNSLHSIDLLPGDVIYERSGGVTGLRKNVRSGDHVLNLFGQRIPLWHNPDPSVKDAEFHPNGQVRVFAAEQDFVYSVTGNSVAVEAGGAGGDCGYAVWSPDAITPTTPRYDSAVNVDEDGQLQSACFSRVQRFNYFGKTIFLRGHFSLNEDGSLEDSFVDPRNALNLVGDPQTGAPLSATEGFRAAFSEGMAEFRDPAVHELPRVMAATRIRGDSLSDADDACVNVFFSLGALTFSSAVSPDQVVYHPIRAAWPSPSQPEDAGAGESFSPAQCRQVFGTACSYLTSLTCYRNMPMRLQ